MKIIIAGSRTISDQQLLDLLIDTCRKEFDTTEVACGKARGVDTCGELWALRHNIPVKYFPAEWEKHGRGAGFIRNRQMAEYADGLIAIWDGMSRGTDHMIQMANCYQIKKFVHTVRKGNSPYYG
jgi:hypothetical protein